MDELEKESELLAHLSELAGILPAYTDNWQKRHITTPATQRMLLTAMGFDVSTPEKIITAIEERELRPWRRALEPVSVLRDQPPWVRLVVQDACAGVEWGWRLEREDGRNQHGQFRPQTLAKIETKNIEGVGYTAWRLVLPEHLPPGYHRLSLSYAEKQLGEQLLIVPPATCYQPEAIANSGRIWGPAVQLYTIRSERNWGIGDFTDLRLLLEQWAAQGADVIGINPLHALFPHNPEHASPYSPSSRLFVNILYLDVEAIADFHECEAARALVHTPEFQIRLEGLRATDLVDYTGVAALKLPMLEMLYHYFCEQHLANGSERATAFRAFQAREGDRLYRHTLFEALQEHFHNQDPAIWGWPVWPEPYRYAESAEVREFESQNRERIEFFTYLQWQADLQLGTAGARSLELELGVGLYLDLAISVDNGGAEAWFNQTLYAIGVGVGAPPELHNQLGQDWGLPPFVPDRLREAAYAPFIATLQHNMRHAGALRLDHVMGLMRQYWVPAGVPPTEGAYVRYPFADLLGILALESQRNQCLVVGEDLGTVPEEVRTALSPMNVLSYRLLLLEKEADGSFVAPMNYPAQALAAVSTHDLPTLPGFWQGRDIIQRTQLQLFSSEEARRSAVVTRAQERAYLFLMLEEAGLLPEDATVNPLSLSIATPEFIQAVYTYLAQGPARIMMVQLEDILEVLDQINIPSTTTQHPNWRRKLPLQLEAWGADRRVLALAAAMRQERPHIRPAPILKRRLRIPLATYRLQLNRNFTFSQAAQLVPYLAMLGISHVYCSPYLKARPGSSHGYDIVDHNALNPEIGTKEEFEAFCTALHAHGMRQVLDLVPNHMGIMGSDNQWWLDVLESGPASFYASFFDIDWQPLKEELRGKVLLPILGRSYGDTLESGEIKLSFDEECGSFSVWYYQHRLPVAPREYPRLLRHRLPLLEAQLRPDSLDLQEIASLITAFDNLPPQEATTPDKILERHRDQELFKRRLATLVSISTPIKQMVLDTVNDYNGNMGDFESFTLLHELLEAQPWRLANWRVASDEINYRRFFDINDLAGLRMEDSYVFDATHQLALELIADGKVDGLRIDHPDGLYDPLQYFQRLQDHVALRSLAVEGEKAVYIVVEKILADHEPLREDWAIHGTTGYDFCNLVNGLFVDLRAKTMLERAYRLFTHTWPDFEKLVYRSKHKIMTHAMASELNVMAGQLSRICELRPHTRDFTTNSLRNALAEVIARLPVYRTYVRDGQATMLDRRYVEWAVAQAKKFTQVLDTSIFDFLSSVLLLDAATDKDPSYVAAITAFAMKFQQLSSPVMAKGYEDTAFYLYHRLVSLNEVGGDPRIFGHSVKAFHAENAKRLERWPYSMLNTSTHDNKRSEDVRARINVLSEIPSQWLEQVRRWQHLNKSKKLLIDREEIPSANDEYLLYQTLIGIWPFGELTEAEHETLLARIEAYMLKAVREAKEYTSWINPNTSYEDGLSAFIRKIMDLSKKNTFLADFLPFQQRVAYWGMFNSLSQTLLKLTSPGVPDIYQGNELWDLSLVDPDNRRPVDYVQRQHLLKELEAFETVPQDALAKQVRQLLDHITDGRAKLFLTWRLLHSRKQWPCVFQNGAYIPLTTTGSRKDHLCAFARHADDIMLIVVAPRWFSRLMPTASEQVPLSNTMWSATTVEVPILTAGAQGVNVLTGETVTVAQTNGLPELFASALFTSFPVALLQFRPPED
ncbi:malto-oligosyltrehalose synthase [Nitrosomonas communis]|uniref:malto-oligosyltrehalose synthase n=1 Tax=Nitrosomonas communis TaxID=44574 RepID=UPI003D2A4496